MEQVQQYQPPSNPAKTTDSRAAAYIEAYGTESWELDALEPDVLGRLTEAEILTHLDHERWNSAVAAEVAGRNLLAQASARWDDVAAFLAEGDA